MVVGNSAPRILCIDDDAVGIRVRKVLLERAGYRVTCATSGSEALQLFGTGEFDAVLLDFYMPEMNGDQVAQKMKEIRPEVPILLYSAYADLTEEELAYVDGYVRKGGPPELLLEMVARIADGKAD